VRQQVAIEPGVSGKSTFRIQLHEGPLTIQCQPDPEPADLAFPPVRERPDLDLGVRSEKPGVALRAAVAVRTADGEWMPVADLLSSSGNKRHFVVDVDGLGRGVLRFGDGEYGRKFSDVTHAEIWYRVGNGRAGNIGAEGI